jgi:hypothetical protein
MDSFEVKPAGVLVKCPPARTDMLADPDTPLLGQMDVRTKWKNTTYIELVVDGKIVDLNRIPLPPDTPIVDERFNIIMSQGTSVGPAAPCHQDSALGFFFAMAPSFALDSGGKEASFFCRFCATRVMATAIFSVHLSQIRSFPSVSGWYMRRSCAAVSRRSILSGNAGLYPWRPQSGQLQIQRLAAALAASKLSWAVWLADFGLCCAAP